MNANKYDVGYRYNTYPQPQQPPRAPSKPNAVLWWVAIGAALVIFFPVAIPIAYFYEKAQREYDEHMRRLGMYYANQFYYNTTGVQR